MATATKKVAVKKTRITGQSIRENAKRDLSPKWEGAEDMSATEFAAHFREAMKYYRLESSGKELKPKVIDWMGRNDYSKEDIAKFKKTKDWRSHLTMGAIAASLIKGMPDVREGFNQGKSAVEWLKNEIATVIEDGKYDVEEVVADKTSKVVVVAPNIQDRLRDAASLMSEEIDGAIDSWITDPEAFNPKEFKMVGLLRGKGAKAAHARFIKTFFQRGMDELHELASGEADEQLREAYKHVSRKNVKKLIEFYESIFAACDQIAQEAKVLKKPRAKKIVPADKLVAKLKFKAIDDKLGIVSVPVVGLIGAQGAVVFNTKTRKLGMYIAKTSAGLGVKGTSITEFTDKSFQKTLRKPPEQLKEFKEQNTQKRIETWFGKIKSVETVMNGRMNEDIMVLKVFK